MATIDTIKDILVENLDIDRNLITEESTFDSLNIDSLDLVQLICDLEEKLDIDFGEPEGLQNLGDVVKHIESL
ncbi:MAG: acyl carrier protein [Eggerthellaceae bacterium]|nr:acyl carrier protein [Eggerthellaceae bacterium]